MNNPFPEDLTSATRIIVLHEGPNPTTDFYLASRLAQQPLAVEWLTLNQCPDPALLQDAALIVVRYLTPKWQRFLDHHVTKLHQFIWLIDAD